MAWVTKALLALAAVALALPAAAACNLSEGLQDRLIRHEGWRSCVYSDQFGNRTIGVGHLLRRPVPNNLCWSQNKVIATLYHDIHRAQSNAQHDIGRNNWKRIPKHVQEAITELSFQLGGHGLAKFRRMLAAIRAHRYGAAANELLDSRLARQTPHRAEELACIIRHRKPSK